MFYVKNDDMEDMDDMMRKAADEYELNHEMASDWNKVYSGIQQPEQNFNAQPEEKKRRKYLLLWLLLIPALLITSYTLHWFSAVTTNDKTVAETKFSQHKMQSDEAKQKDNNAVADNNKASANQRKLNAEADVADDDKKIKSTIFNSSIIKKNKAAINNDVADGSSNNASTNNNSTINKTAEINNDDKQVSSASRQDASLQQTTLTKAATGVTVSETNITSSIINADTTSIKKQAVKDTVTSLQKNKSSDSTVAKSSIKKNKTNNYARQAFMYAGLLANADVSFIKNQKISKLALGAGIVGGYHFKNGLSIETGLLYDKKNYTTKGKYFNTDKLSYLQNVQLLAADGSCYMFEIPLNIAYDFKAHKKYNWFVTSGFSSYLMHKEYYNFKYDYNGMYGERPYDYYHTSKNWFALLNIGAGVNIQTSNKYFIRAQPYYKIPLSGVGIGSLPLSSAGINFSLIRRIP